MTVTFRISNLFQILSLFHTGDLSVMSIGKQRITMPSFDIYSPTALPKNDIKSDDRRKKDQRSSRLPLSPLNSNSLGLRESKKRSFHETTASEEKTKSLPLDQEFPLRKEVIFALPQLSKQSLKDASNDCPQQQNLKKSRCSLFCLDVVSSAIIRALKKEVKMKQSKLQRCKASDDIVII